MQQSHGIGYREYSQRLDKRMQIERKREQSYKKSRQMVAEIDHLLHR
ncbi:hypothetical protein [Tenuibacillus multivorans]|uniref:Uncharacterized protein n=1 Tax=Tenuibacillus multivorans TaxID=237069 RepID=A0A1H0DAI2_9BACI|nr:hypothetical protein [Tenuibacillus multivorans]GEL76639.1 hypothetical protein TMU01_08740 [Tenuibacillus multivorans]SDN66956.1 hypothetical protein SAMN05216498_2781 [Tenuibacillus multivorans]